MKKSVALISAIVIVVGILVGGFFVYKTTVKPTKKTPAIKNVSACLSPSNTYQKLYCPPWDSDQKNVYYYGKIVEDADLATFSLLQNSYAKDKLNAYYYKGPREFAAPIIKIDRADASSFEVLNDDWAKDKNNLYFQGKAIPNSDPASFIIEKNSLPHDKSHVYNGDGEIILTDNADSLSSFTYIKNSQGYYKDKNNVYQFDGFNLNPINADPETYTIIGGCAGGEGGGVLYGKDKNHIYCDSTVLADADLQTFTFVGIFDENPGGMPGYSGIAKDKNCVYRAGQKVLGSNGQCINPVTCVPSDKQSDAVNGSTVDIKGCGLPILKTLEY